MCAQTGKMIKCFFFSKWARSFIFEKASEIMSFSLAFFTSLQLDWATTMGRLLGPATQRWRHLVKYLAQGHNKQICWLVLHNITFVQSAKQESCEYRFVVFWYGLTWEVNPRSTKCKAYTLTTTPSRWW